LQTRGTVSKSATG